eukprot:scaffold89680_cov49-Attheya_sp.AAC.1
MGENDSDRAINNGLVVVCTLLLEGLVAVLVILSVLALVSMPDRERMREKRVLAEGDDGAVANTCAVSLNECITPNTISSSSSSSSSCVVVDVVVVVGMGVTTSGGCNTKGSGSDDAEANDVEPIPPPPPPLDDNSLLGCALDDEPLVFDLDVVVVVAVDVVDVGIVVLRKVDLEQFFLSKTVVTTGPV